MLLVAMGVQAEILHESAELGAGIGTLSLIPGEQGMRASRFSLTAETEITAIGAYAASVGGSVFLAIVPLPSPTGLPTGDVEDIALVHAIYDSGGSLVDHRASVSVILPPGDYALVIGAGAFGATGTVVLVFGNPELPGTSYISGNRFGWSDGAVQTGMRFVVEGLTVVGYVGELQVIDAAGTEPDFQAGDNFTFTFRIDDSDTDSNGSPSFGNFDNAVTSFRLTRRSGNAGTWDPASGTFATRDLFTIDDNPTDGWSLLAGGTGFPSAGGDLFDGLSINTTSASTVLINDTGAGQSLADQSGGAFNPILFTPDPAFAAVFSFGFTEIVLDIRTLNAIPEPALVFENPSPDVSDGFGNSVSVAGDRVLIGAVQDDTTGDTSGRAYLFDAMTGTLVQTFDNPGSNPANDDFGNSVSVAGDRVLIGAVQDDTTGNDSGRAYLFDAVTGNLAQTFDNPSPGVNDLFGISVSVAGDRVLIGAFGDDTTGNGSGRAYLFDAVTGNLVRPFDNPSPFPSDGFGRSVSVAGDRVLIGAHLDDSTMVNTGKAYLFDAVTGNLAQTFDNPSPNSNDGFGFSVSVAGDRVLIGAASDDATGNNSGRAYLFDAVSGNLVHTFENPSPDAIDAFGESVSVAGDRVLIGADTDDTTGNNSGRAYLFDAISGNLVQTFDNPSPDANDLFGISVSVAGNRVLIGANGDDTTDGNSGRAYLFTVVPANDDRDAAQQIDLGQFSGSLVGATPDGTANCAGGASNDQPDIWYRYTAPAAGVLQVSTCGTNDLNGLDAGTDTVLSLQSDDGSTELACNDDWTESADPTRCAGLDESEELDSYIEAAVQTGESVVIRIGKFGNSPAEDILVNTNLVIDSDGDGLLDNMDNCTLQENADQRDTNGDGYGNICDPDFNGNGIVDPFDFSLLKSRFGQSGFPDQDLNGNGIVDPFDFSKLKSMFGQPPGPSGIVP